MNNLSIMVGFRLNSFVFLIGTLFSFLFTNSELYGQGLSVSSCPAVVKRSNGNGAATSAAGDFTPTYAQNNPVADNVVGTPYQKVPFDPASKTGNFLFSWVAPTAPTNLPVITRVWLTASGSTSTTLSPIKFGPPPPPTLSGNTWVVNYCFYVQNLPNAGVLTLEFADPQTGSSAFFCSYELGGNTTAPTPNFSCAPTIVTNPVNVTAACGATAPAVFTAEASGATDYVWQKSLNSGSTWLSITPGGDYSVALTSGTTTLSVSNPVSHDGELYRVQFLGGTGANGLPCGNTLTGSAKLTAKPTPTATVPSVNVLCGAGPVSIPVTLSGTAPWTITYRKTTGGTSSDFTVSASQSPYFLTDAPSNATTYTILSVSDQFCSANLTAGNVYFYGKVPDLTPGTNPIICFGAVTASLPFSATSDNPDKYSITAGTRAMAGFTAVSGATLGSSPIAITLPSNTPAGTYDFNLQVQNSTSSCSSALIPFTVTVSSTPVIAASASVASICQGGSVTLSASSGFSSYAWRIKNNATVISTSASPTVAVSGTTTYEVTGTDANGCTATAETTVTTFSVGTITVTASGTGICSGNSVLLTASGASSYSWSPSTGLSGTTGSSVTASPTTTTTYTATGTNSQGCQTNESVTITVNAPNITVTGAGTICEGIVQTLTASGGTSYKWWPASTLYTSAAATTLIDPSLSYTIVYAKPTATTTYQVNGTDASGCSKVQTVTVTINASPVNTATTVQAIDIFCSKAVSVNGTIPLTVNTNTSATFAFAYSSDGITYTSFNAAVTQGNVLATPSTTATSGTITLSSINNSYPAAFNFFRYTVTSGGCTVNYVIRVYDSNSGTTGVTTFQVSSPTICSGSSTTLNSGGFLSSYTIQWQSSPDNATWTNIPGATSAIATVSPTASTWYRYVLSSSTAQCGTTSNSSQVVVNAAITGNTVTSAVSCTDGTSTVTLNGSTLTGVTYQWQSSTDNITFSAIVGATSEDYVIPGNIVPVRTYFRRLASKSPCSDNASASVTIDPPLSGNTVSAAASSYCATASATLITGSTPVGGTGSYTYQWQSSTNGTNYSNIASATSKDYTTPANVTETTYYQRVVTSGSCPTSSAVALITVNANPTVSVSPSSTSLCAGLSTTLTASGAVNYSWSPSSGLSSTIGSTVVATPSASGSYTVTGSDINGCTGTAVASFTVTALPSVPTLSSSSETICSGSSISLTGKVTSGGTVEWFTVPEPTAAYKIAAPASVSSAGTYYAYAKSGLCYSAAYASFTLKVDDVSKPSLASASLTSCANVDITVLQPATRTGVTYEWHTVASNPTAGDKVSTPSSVGTGTYYLYAYSTAGLCFGPASDAVSVTVVTPASATVSSTSIAVCSPNTVDISALNTTSGTNTYIWYTQSTPDPTKVVADPTTISASGDFYLVPFTSGCQGTVSPKVSVVINQKPIVTIGNPGLVCATAGSTSISVSITNTVTSPTYQWQSSTDGVSWTNVSNGTTYSNVTTATLSISGVSGLNGTFYRALVSGNNCSVESDYSVLAVEPVLTITGQPSNTTVLFGQNAVFTATLTNAQTAELQWQVSANSTGPWADLAESSPYSGTLTPQLTITSAPASLSGKYYRLRASTACDNYETSAAQLTVESDLSWSLVKTATETSYKTAGDNLNYSLALTNTGIIDISSVSVTDPGADAAPVRGTDNPGDNDAVLEAGETWIYTATHTIVAADVSAGAYTNSASASGTPAAGTLTNTTSSVTVCAKPVLSGDTQLCLGETGTLSSTGTPATVNPWVSSNTSVATVSSGGLVTSVAVGTAVITFTTLQGCTETVTVTVNALPSISGTLYACIGQTTQLSGSGTSDSSTPWASSNTAVATVSNTGVVTGVSAGTVTITYTNNLGCQTTAEVTIKALPNITGTLSACEGLSTQLTGSGTAATSNAWTSSDTNVATVSSTGLVTGVLAGTAIITYTNSDGCQQTTTVTINALPAISGTLSACIGLTTQLTGSGTAATSNPWTSSDTNVATVSSTGLVTGVSAGTAAITYTNSDGCQKTATVTINELPTISGTLSACIGQTTQLTGSATPDSSNPWSSGNTAVATISSSGLVTGVAAGTVTITYTNNNGCQQTVIVTINALPSISGTLSACVGATTQLAGSGTAASSNAWLSGNISVATVDNAGLVSGVAAGTTTITYTNSDGCQQTATVTINPLPTISGTLSACVGLTTQLTGSGTPAANSPWTSGNTAVATVGNTGVVTGISAGTSLITYLNSDGCQQSVTVTINGLPSISGTLSVCIGQTTQLTGSGTADSSAPWVSSNTAVATVDNSGVVTGISAGIVTITYTNADGCQTTAVVTVTALPTISGTLSACIGGTTQLTGSGTADANTPWVSSNTSVATVSSTGLVTGVAAGTATITYKDSNGCEKAALVTVNGLPEISSSITNVTCNGGSNGAINLTVTGGSGSYLYLWSNGASSEDLSALVAGSYSVTVTDGNNCEKSASFSVTEPSAITIDVPSITNVTCNGGVNGSIEITASGGTGTLSYSKDGSTFQSGNIFSGLSAGDYTITVRDQNLCTSTAFASISQPLNISVAAAKTDVSCNSGTDGTIIVTASGGTGVLNFSKDGTTFQASGTFSGLSSGDYTITVKDENSCTTTVQVTITQPSAALSATTTQVNVSCFGGVTGSADLTVTGGTGPYTYQWSNSAVTEDVTGLAAGDYSVTITDSKSCTTTAQVTITQPSAALAASASSAGVTCNGGSDGSITVTASGGTGALTYSKDGTNFQPGNVFSGLIPGNYAITIKDANSCIKTVNATVINPGAISAPGPIAGPVSVLSASVNIYQVPAVSGATGYTWTLPAGWSGNSSTNSIQATAGSQGGTITVTVSVGGCSSPAASLDVAINSSLVVATDDQFGELTVNCSQDVIGGNVLSNDTFNNQPVTAAISDELTLTIVSDGGLTGVTVSSVGDLIIPAGSSPGSYTISYKLCELADPSNCDEGSVSVRIKEQPVQVPEAISPQGDGRNDKWVIRGIDCYPENSVSVFNRWGNLVFKSKSYQNDWDGKSNNGLTVSSGDLVPAGTYYYIIDLGKGKLLTGYIYVAY